MTSIHLRPPKKALTHFFYFYRNRSTLGPIEVQAHDSRRNPAMARRASQQPTDGELEILKVLWEIGPVGLGQLHATLLELKPVALTTVATMLKLMLAKDLVRREDGPRGYLWSSRVSRKSAVSGLLGKLLDHAFDGSARRLVAHLIQEGQLDRHECAEILELLESQSSREASPTREGAGR
jgi:predicted transcriptional regulator